MYLYTITILNMKIKANGRRLICTWAMIKNYSTKSNAAVISNLMGLQSLHTGFNVNKIQFTTIQCSSMILFSNISGIIVLHACPNEHTYSAGAKSLHTPGRKTLFLKLSQFLSFLPAYIFIGTDKLALCLMCTVHTSNKNTLRHIYS